MRRRDMRSPFIHDAFKYVVKAYFNGIEGSEELGPYDDLHDAQALAQDINFGKVPAFAEAQVVAK